MLPAPVGVSSSRREETGSPGWPPNCSRRAAGCDRGGAGVGGWRPDGLEDEDGHRFRAGEDGGSRRSHGRPESFDRADRRPGPRRAPLAVEALVRRSLLRGERGRRRTPLDYMRGHMSAREIADMSGQVWDHLPAMLPHFREGKIPVPTLTQGEMADLIAFLHSGKGAKASAPPAHPGMTGMSGMGGEMGAARGKGVFLSAGCGACHTFTAAGTRATVGLNLDRTLTG